MTAFRRGIDRATVQHALIAAGWQGTALPCVRISGHDVYPVILPRNPGWRARVDAGQLPELDHSTLLLWEQFPDLDAPPSPVQIVGWVSAATTFTPALRAARQLSDSGAAMVIHTSQRGLSPEHLIAADLYEVTVVWYPPGRGPGPLVNVAHRPRDTERCVTARYHEEVLFGHALAHGLPYPEPTFAALADGSRNPHECSATQRTPRNTRRPR